MIELSHEEILKTTLLSTSCARIQQFLLDQIKETPYYKRNVKLKNAGSQFANLLENHIGKSYRELVVTNEPENEKAFNHITNTLEDILKCVIETPFEKQQELGDILKEFLITNKIKEEWKIKQ